MLLIVVTKVLVDVEEAAVVELVEVDDVEFVDVVELVDVDVEELVDVVGEEYPVEIIETVPWLKFVTYTSPF